MGEHMKNRMKNRTELCDFGSAIRGVGKKLKTNRRHTRRRLVGAWLLHNHFRNTVARPGVHQIT